MTPTGMGVLSSISGGFSAAITATCAQPAAKEHTHATPLSPQGHESAMHVRSSGTMARSRVWAVYGVCVLTLHSLSGCRYTAISDACGQDA